MSFNIGTVFNRLALLLLLCTIAMPASAQRITTTASDGDNGAAGTDADPGTDGGDGTLGTAITDFINGIGELYRGLAAGNGGSGGNGGNAISDGFDGGDGGNGAMGGTASGSIRSEGSGRSVADLNIIAGNGGDGGAGGQAMGTGIDGSGGNGGDGGIAIADAQGAIAISTDGEARAALTVIAGNGGNALSGNGLGGAGQDASLIDITASAFGVTEANSLAEAQSGSGGDGVGTGNGGHGGNAVLRNAVDATVDPGGEISLSQTIFAGSGGHAQAGLAGDGGSSTNELTRSVDATAANFNFYSNAGGGGSRNHSSGLSGNGGNAAIEANISQSGDLYHYSETRAGAAGNAAGGASGGLGGNVTATTVLETISGMIDSYDVAWAGDGGWIDSGLGVGGTGGVAQLQLSATTSSGSDVSMEGYAFGGEGGLAFGDINGSGGNGGTAGGTVSATTTTGSASAYGYYQGGGGGDVIGGTGNSGNGASVEVLNQVTAHSTDVNGDTFVEQSVYGGDAGNVGYQSNLGSGAIGSAGSAKGTLSANNDNIDSTLWSYAYGGSGGDRNHTSGVAGDGASGESSVVLSNTGAATALASAGGGYGGTGTAGATGGQGASGAADATATSTNAESYAYAYGFGGDGGQTVDGSEMGGNAYDASASASSLATSQALGQYAEAYSEAIGGFGYGFDSRYLSSRSGIAVAEATAITNQGDAYSVSSAEGRIAQAKATGDGLTGTVDATAKTVRGELGVSNDDVIQIRSQITADVHGLTSVETIVANDGTTNFTSNANVFSIIEVTSTAVSSPMASLVSLSSGELAPASEAMPLSAQDSLVISGQIGASHPTNVLTSVNAMISTTLDFKDVVDASRASIQWSSFNTTGNGFDTMEVVIGTQLSDHQWNFANASEAETFFANELVLDELSDADRSLTMQINWSSSDINNSFGLGFSTTVTAIPEPSAALLLCVATISGGLCRRRSR
ncbi:hypothetical protein LOC67_02360 [Stieleria sp. JC731]|uniref:beta strand repeat-containing protein n=1 Tax=Pirellulaceae TaxID=2691357 RepID=UPI001E37E1E3|nr:hypothetical protein [Stieleria sp. JC731]MCC9599387.1 hypothetical protein [Stieleria sp. JC731]